VTDASKAVVDLIHSFNVNCEAKGHYWADNSTRHGWQYCEACGAARETPTPKEQE